MMMMMMMTIPTTGVGVNRQLAFGWMFDSLWVFFSIFLWRSWDVLVGVALGVINEASSVVVPFVRPLTYFRYQKWSSCIRLLFYNREALHHVFQ
jgi:hypothetical protein